MSGQAPHWSERARSTDQPAYIPAPGPRQTPPRRSRRKYLIGAAAVLVVVAAVVAAVLLTSGRSTGSPSASASTVADSAASTAVSPGSATATEPPAGASGPATTVGAADPGATTTTESLADEPLLFDEGRVRVLCVLDEPERAVPVYSLQPESLDFEAMATRVVGETAEVERDGDTAHCSAYPVEFILHERTGELQLSRHDLTTAMGGTPLDYRTALAKAEDFIADAGGLPPGYRLAEVPGTDVRDVTTGEVEARAMWTFVYLPVVDGIPVAESGGMFISLKVAAGGVYHYRRWAPSPVPLGPSQTVLSAEAAITIAAPSLRAAFRPIPVPESVDIVEVTLVYLSPTLLDYEESGMTELRPVYSLVAEGMDIAVCIDACDGSLLVFAD